MIQREAYSEAAIARRLTHLLLAILLGFGLVALALSYWSVVRSSALAERLDNPRLVEAELRVQRGRILDRSDIVLAANSGPAERQARSYPLAEAGPAVGHYSLRYGATGIEASYDDVLRGQTTSGAQQMLDDLLHVPPTGQDVRLTLDANLQLSAAQLMTGQQGALVLLELMGTADTPTAEIRAMVSQPWYDPAELDTLFAGLSADGENVSLFNRATQGQYQPGLVLFPLLAAAGIDNGAIDPTAEVSQANRAVGEGNFVQRCLNELETEHPTWLEAVGGLCPGAAVELGEQLGSTALMNALLSLGLLSPPTVPIPVADAVVPGIDDVGLAALGQEALTVSPLQTALAYSVLGEGRLPAPRLVDALQSPAGEWERIEAEQAIGQAGPALNPATATAVRRALPSAGQISGLAVPVLSAPDGQVNQWYVGLAPSTDPRYIVVVVLEQPQEDSAAADIGQAVLTQALQQP